MTKSSEVLRLAAEHALDGDYPYVSNALRDFGIDPLKTNLWGFLERIGVQFSRFPEDCLMLCLAADIAESEGD